MPTNPTFPGVYVEEIPSGVRTVTGVATSITAFIGRTERGEVNKPVIINSFGDFERSFGGLHVDYPLSYAVRDFYLNGGSQAIIVRLFAVRDEEAIVREVAEAAAKKAASGATNESIMVAARRRADPIMSAAEAVASAAEDMSASAVPTTLKTVIKDAALNEAAPIKSAAEAVAKAAEDEAAKSSSTKESIKDAARNEAAPIKSAAEAVAKAAEDEVTYNVSATVESVKKAARGKADDIKTQIPSQKAKDAAEAVAKAAEAQLDTATKDTVKQAARHRAESTKSAAEAVAKAAEDEVTNNPANATKDTVKQAALNEAAPIKSAAEAVAKAAEDEAAKSSSTKESIKDAARNEAAPIKSAAEAVAKAAEDEANKYGATVESVKKAARGKADDIKTQIPSQKAKDAAEAVAMAAEDEVKNNPEPTAASVKKAALDKAGEIIRAQSTSQKAKDAAETVAEAATKQPDSAPPNSVSDAVADAVEHAVATFNGRAKVNLDPDFRLQAASPGAWGNKLEVKVDYEGTDLFAADGSALDQADLFNLTIRDIFPDGQVERFPNVSVKLDSPRCLDRILVQESQLVRLWERNGNRPTQRPYKTHGDNPGTSPPSVGSQTSGNGAGGGVATLTQLEQAAQQENKRFTPFDNGEDSAHLKPKNYVGSLEDQTGLYALEKADLFNLLCIPPDVRSGDTPTPVYQEAMVYCDKRRAMLIVDPPAAWGAGQGAAQRASDALRNNELKLSGRQTRNAALYFPRIKQADLKRDGQVDTFAPSGMIAGVMASTDVQRGVWKAPAGIDASLLIDGLQVDLTDAENGMLNPLGINCLRTFPIIGSVVWGARTLRGADQLADEYKYVPVRRLALYIEESLYRGLKWVVFEPNDEPLWAQIRLNVGAFMHNLFRQGAFQGQTPQKAYFVKCDHETTTQNDINLGIVNIVVGFAPLKPAEFVILKLQQMAGEIEV